MAMPIREHTIEQIRTRMATMNTSLNKINYLESALGVAGFSFELKRFLWKELSVLYEERKMFERAARAMANKAGAEVSVRDKTDSYVNAAELYSKAGKVDMADDMFVRALRDSDDSNKARIKLARKNIFMFLARELENKGRKASAVKFYEKLIKMNLEEIEKQEIRNKLLLTYKALGMFSEARLLEGM